MFSLLRRAHLPAAVHRATAAAWVGAGVKCDRSIPQVNALDTLHPCKPDRRHMILELLDTGATAVPTKSGALSPRARVYARRFDRLKGA